MENVYQVKKCESKSPIFVKVPGSKSITNRALMLAALSAGDCLLKGTLFSDDSRAFIDCLIRLGFSLRVDEKSECVWVKGTRGDIPNKNAEINVRSAGTAARFLTVMLAFAGGDYTLRSSEQMKKRPMEQLITALREVGIKIECLEEENHFPFRLQSDGIKAQSITIDTTVSSQFASAILMASVLTKKGLKVLTTGNRTSGSYIKITTKVMKQFGIPFEENEREYFIPHNHCFHRKEYIIEPDFSAACYFFAAGAVLNRPVIVRGLNRQSIQGDKKFIDVLEKMGCICGEQNGELVLMGTNQLKGLTVDMNDFSDQALTLSAIAPFADCPVEIRNIRHIRKQECDRIHAIAANLEKMNIRYKEGEDFIKIFPGDIRPAVIDTFDDHRVAMAFAVAGLRDGNLAIENASCCKKTFENFFDVLETIYR